MALAKSPKGFEKFYEKEKGEKPDNEENDPDKEMVANSKPVPPGTFVPVFPDFP